MYKFKENSIDLRFRELKNRYSASECELIEAYWTENKARYGNHTAGLERAVRDALAESLKTDSIRDNRYGFLALPVNKYESFDSAEKAEERLAEVKLLPRLAKNRTCSLGTNGYGTWWVTYTIK